MRPKSGQKTVSVPNGVNLGRMRTRRRVTLEQERRSENGDWQPICGVFGANSVPVPSFRGTAYNTLGFTAFVPVPVFPRAMFRLTTAGLLSCCWSYAGLAFSVTSF